MVGGPDGVDLRVHLPLLTLTSIGTCRAAPALDMAAWKREPTRTQSAEASGILVRVLRQRARCRLAALLRKAGLKYELLSASAFSHSPL